MFLNVHDDIPSLMKGQVLPLMDLHFFMEGVFEVGVFVCFSFAITRRSGRFRGRFSYAIKGRSEKAQSLQHIFNLYIHSYIQFTISRELPPA